MIIIIIIIIIINKEGFEMNNHSVKNRSATIRNGASFLVIYVVKNGLLKDKKVQDAEFRNQCEDINKKRGGHEFQFIE